VPATPPDALGNPIIDFFAGESSHVVPARWQLQDGRRLAINIGETALDVDGVIVPPRASRLLP
jgi:hypothetical protein